MLVVKLQSSEEIKKKYLLKFITTNLKNIKIKLTSKNRVYISYIKSMSIYQVFIFENKIPQIFFYEPQKEFELLLSKNFFVLYKDYKVYYHEEVEKVNIDDIYFYVKKNFNFKNIKILYMEDIILNNQPRDIFEKPIKSKLFKLFLFYMFFLLFGFYFYENSKTHSSFNDFIKKFQSKKKEIAYKYIVGDVLKIFTIAKKNEVEIISLEYKGKLFFVVFSSKKEKNLDSFLKSFNSYKLEKMEDNKIENRVIINAYFKFD